MSIHRKDAKRDANERQIIEALKAAGCSVQQLSGKGLPDLLVGITNTHLRFHRRDDEGYLENVPINILMEVKAPKAKLTADEITWHSEWRGQVVIVRSVADALRVIGRLPWA